jgi:hypothetical protein
VRYMAKSDIARTLTGKRSRWLRGWIAFLPLEDFGAAGGFGGQTYSEPEASKFLTSLEAITPICK